MESTRRYLYETRGAGCASNVRTWTARCILGIPIVLDSGCTGFKRRNRRGRIRPVRNPLPSIPRRTPPSRLDTARTTSRFPSRRSSTQARWFCAGLRRARRRRGYAAAARGRGGHAGDEWQQQLQPMIRTIMEQARAGRACAAAPSVSPVITYEEGTSLPGADQIDCPVGRRRRRGQVASRGRA